MEVGNICFLFGISEIVFIEMFIERAYMFHMNFVQIADFGWLTGQHKGYVFWGKNKKTFSGTVNGMQGKFYIHIYYLSVYKNYILIVVPHSLLLLWRLTVSID